MALRHALLLSLALLVAPAAAQEKKADSPKPEQQASELDAVFFTGDCSLGNFSRQSCAHLWPKYFGKLKTVPVTTVRHAKPNGKELRWTIPAGKLEGYQAKVVVLSMGGYPVIFEGESPEAAVEGLAVCLKDVCARQPKATVLLLGLPVPPISHFYDRPIGPDQQPMKNKVARMKELTMEMVTKLAADGKRVRYVDPVPKLEARKKEIAEGVAKVPDFHDIPEAWEGIAEALAEPLTEILKAEKAR
jgi:hypothetical protein